MSQRAFYAQRMWWPVLCLGVVGGIWASLSWWDILGEFRAELPAEVGGRVGFLLSVLALGCLIVAGLSILSLWRLRRPVLSISDTRLEYVPVLGVRRRAVDGTQVRGIARSSRRRIVLETREGKYVSIHLAWLPRRQRPAAREAINGWVTEHLRGGTDHEEV
jgi:hypothetical protein